MDNQNNTVQETSLNDAILRELLEVEVILIGGGNIAVNGY